MSDLVAAGVLVALALVVGVFTVLVPRFLLARHRDRSFARAAAAPRRFRVAWALALVGLALLAEATSVEALAAGALDPLVHVLFTGVGSVLALAGFAELNVLVRSPAPDEAAPSPGPGPYAWMAPTVGASVVGGGVLAAMVVPDAAPDLPLVHVVTFAALAAAATLLGTRRPLGTRGGAGEAGPSEPVRARPEADLDGPMVQIHDPRRNVSRVSDAFAATFGMSAEALEEDPDAWLDLVHPDDAARVRAGARAGSSSGFEGEYRIRGAAGGERWIRDRVMVEDPDDPDSRWVRVTEDVTGAHRADERLHASEERYRGLVERSPDLVASVDAGDGTILTANRAHARLLGRDPDGLVGRPITALVHPDDRDRVAGILDALREGDPPGPTEVRFLHADGSVRHVEVAVLPRYEDGEAVAFQAVGRDVTARKRAEAQRDRLADIVHESPDLVGTATAGGRVLSLNPAWCDLLGIPEDAPLGDVRIEHLHPDDERDRILQVAVPAALEEGTWRGRTRVVDATGEAVPVDQVIVAHRDDGGEVTHLSTVLRDLRAQEELQRELQEREARWRSLVEDHPDFIVELDLEGRLRYVNQTLPEVDPEELVGVDVRDMMSPDARDEFSRVFERVVETREPVSYEATSIWPGAEGVVFSVRATPIVEDEVVVGVLLAARDVTEQTEAQRERDEVLARVEAYLGAADDVAFVVDPEDGTLRFLSDGFERITGRSTEEVLGRPFLELVHPDDRPEVRSDYQAALAGEDPRPTEARVERSDGTYAHVSLLGRPIREDGEVVEHVGIARDVTARVEAERARGILQHRFRTYLDSTQDVAFTLDAEEGGITSLSAAFHELTGWRRDEWVGRSFVDLVDPDDLPEAMEAYGVAVDGGNPDVVEVGIRCRDGTVLPMSVGASPVVQDGRVQEVFGIARDVSEFKRVESESDLLRDLSLALTGTSHRDEVVDVLHDQLTRERRWDIVEVWTVDEARVVLVRERCTQTLGPEAAWWCEDGTAPDVARGEGLAGRAWERGDPVWMEDVSRSEAFDRTELAGELDLAAGIAVPIPLGDGTEMVALLLDREVRHVDARRKAFLEAVATTVGGALQRIQQEEELVERARELADGNRQLRGLARASAHQFREPVRDIVRFAQLLKRRAGDELGPDAREQLGYIQAGGHRLEDLSDAVLEYTQASLGDAELQPVDVDPLVERVVASLRDEAEDGDARITVEPAGARIRADAKGLERVLRELVENALRFHGDDPPRIRVSWEQVEDSWVLRVRDEGPGIDPAYHERVFHPFETLEHRSAGSGVGIGLPVARRLVEAMDGTIWLRSAAGAGTTVLVALPGAGGDDAA